MNKASCLERNEIFGWMRKNLSNCSYLASVFSGLYFEVSVWKCSLSINCDLMQLAWKTAALNQDWLHTIHSTCCPITGLSLRLTLQN